MGLVRGDARAATTVDDALGSIRPAIRTALCFGLFINLLLFVSPLYMLQIYDRAIPSRSWVTLAGLTVVALYLIAAYAALDYFRSQVMARAGLQFDRRLAEAVFTATHRSHLSARGGERLNALRDIDSIREVIVGQGLVALTDVPAIPIFVAVCFMLHPWFGVLAVIAAATLLMLTVLNEGLTKPDVKAAHAAAAHAGAHAEAALRNVEVLQAMGMRAPMRATWLKLHAEALDRSDAAGRKGGRIGAATKFARLAIQTAVLGIGAHLAIQREISPGAIIAASIIVGRVIAPVEQLIANWKAFIHARGARARLDALLSNHGAGPKPVALPRPVGRLTIDQMSAAPPGGRHLVLQRVSLALEAGETLAVVGPSASGKSSLARVICGVWRPMAGTVRLDGAELHHWDPEKLGDHIGYLPQDVELFAGTVAQNIARFREAAPAEVIETAKLAGCHDMIQSLPDGYNTQIGERGVALSGGQRQRIGLARAFFGMPPLVVLDEPNANLDAEGEAALVQAIRRYRGAGRTIVLITHRPSVVSDVDKVLLIVEGQPRLFGPRDEVLAQLTPAAAA